MISPGPCTPDARPGVSLAAIREFAGKMPMLGVCLGHQAIGQAFGGKVVHAGRLMHGKTSPIRHSGRACSAACRAPSWRRATIRWRFRRETLPECLEVTAESEDGEIMGVRHRELAVEGVQFHPESVLTEHGHALLKNFLRQEAA